MIDGATEQVTLDELIQLALDARMAEVHTSMPAVVESYDKDAGTVKVTLPVNKAVPDGSGNFVSEPYPQLADIRVAWPGAGKFLITWPLEKGDEGTLDVCMRNIGPWRTTGAAGDPGDIGLHTLDGAVFRPSPLTDSKPPTTASASNMVIGSTTDAKGRIVCKPAAGELGQGATKGIARSGDGVKVTGISAFTASSLTFSTVDSAGVAGTVTISVAGGALVVATIGGVVTPLKFSGAVASASSSWTCED